MYRSCTMRLAYFAADVPHLQFSANRLARGMSAPTRGHWNRLKRTCRYLKGHGRWIQEYRLQEPVTTLDIYTDSNWAADVLERKSVSCVITMLGKHCKRGQVSTQSVPALSTGEAEFTANVKGGSTVGETDEFGITALERTIHARDVHATILDLMGLDSQRLTYVQSDVTRKLTTETGADVLTEIIA